MGLDVWESRPAVGRRGDGETRGWRGCVVWVGVDGDGEAPTKHESENCDLDEGGWDVCGSSRLHV